MKQNFISKPFKKIGLLFLVIMSSYAVHAQTSYYFDADGDTYGDLNSTTISTTGAPPNYVLNSTDCNDLNSNINPGAPEIACNNIDDDCDGIVDENSVFVTYYQDADGDTYGNINSPISTCDGLPPGYVTNTLDCNDLNANINPGAPEIACNNLDDDCDGTVDENSPPTVTYYTDVDGDGYGNINYPNPSCTGAPPGYVTNTLDCNDLNANINPGAPEIACNNLDDDCDGTVDENSPPTVTYYNLAPANYILQLITNNAQTSSLIQKR